MTKQVLILSTVGVVVLGSALAFGASQGKSGWCGSHAGGFSPAHWGKHGDGQHRVDVIAEVLDLNDAQKEKLQGVHNTMKDARQAFGDVRLQTIDEVLGLVTSDTLDQSQVQQIVKRHQALVDDFAPKVTARIAEFHASLTPAQKSKAAEFIQKWKSRMERRGKHKA
ncbi:MAG: Spy/CpxP family protein refolding chaperone [Nitrospirales bacterium]|nr:Spy/CpxP family protein refolding chaperone [Nitrospira sp.]MDR4501276.1 Spy/CpxP family protein refolding chaperone [Nitrospirales bacterium]